MTKCVEIGQKRQIMVVVSFKMNQFIQIKVLIWGLTFLFWLSFILIIVGKKAVNSDWIVSTLVDILCQYSRVILISKHTAFVLLLLVTNTYWTNQVNKKGWACLVAAQFVCQYCSEPHQSPTSVSVQHGQPHSPPLSLSLSFLLHNLPTSLYPLSFSSHTWKPAWLVTVSGTSFTMRTLGAESRERRLLLNTHMHSYTQQFPLHGPERVIEGEGLVTLILLRLPVSCRLSPRGSYKHTDPSCVYVCLHVCIFYFLVLNSDFRKSLVSNHWRKASQIPLLSSEVEYCL